MTRFLHTADWQIGRRFPRFAQEDAAALHEARFDAVERIARLAAKHQVDAILVAGDLFDFQSVGARTIHKVFRATEHFLGPWLVIPGNHDAALSESVWTAAERIQAIPEHVHVLTRSEVKVFDELGFCVLPAPLTQRHTHEDLTAWFDDAETPSGLLRIGLAHGSVTGVLPEATDSHNPIAADRTATARLDYLALGDWHGTKKIDERTWYSGTPEPERFKDNDPGNVLIVDIAQPGALPEVITHRTARHSWSSLTRRLSVTSDIDDLLQQLEALPEASVIELTLEGQSSLADRNRLALAQDKLAARHRSLVVHENGLRLEPTEEDLAALQADGYVGEVITALREEQQAAQEDDFTAQDALAILADLLAEHPQEARNEA